MAERISLGNGKYCYSGPNCAWHSPNGVSAAKKELRQAYQQLQNSATLGDLVNARERLTAAQKQYDATTEGSNWLLKQYLEERDPVEKNALNKRISEAEEYLKSRETVAKALADSENGVVDLETFFAQGHTYAEPTVNVEDQDTMYPKRVGSNYDPKASTSDIAKKLRKDLISAQNHKYLPKGLEYKVTHSTKDRHVDITVMGLTDDQIETDDGRYTKGALTLKLRLQKMTNSYRYDASNAQIDYFQTSHYSSVRLETAREKAYRVREAARLKEQTQTSALRKQLKHQQGRQENDLSPDYGLTFNNKNTLSSGEPYSTVQGQPNIIAVKNVNTGKINFYNLIGSSVAAQPGSNERTPLSANLGGHTIFQLRRFWI